MHVISTSDLMPPDWTFLAPINDRPELTFSTVSGRAGEGLARLIRHPMAARMQAAFKASAAARRMDGAVLMSHLPLMAAATNIARRTMAPAVPQIAFSFNFTALPTGLRLNLLRRTFEGIAEFVVFSQFERQLYAQAFGIPAHKLVFLPWAMDPPQPGPENPMAGAGPYICAVGGEGRDYATFARAMQARPDLRAAIVARSYSVAGITLPANVTLFIDLPGPKTWALVAGAQAMVLPLRDGRTACGHITLVGAQLLGLPVIVTDSLGVADYVGGDKVAARVPPGDAEAILAALSEVVGNASVLQKARQQVPQAQSDHDPHIWLRYVASKGGLIGR